MLTQPMHRILQSAGDPTHRTMIDKDTALIRRQWDSNFPNRITAIGQPLTTNVILHSLLLPVFWGGPLGDAATENWGEGLCLGNSEAALTRVGVMFPYWYALLGSFMAVHIDFGGFKEKPTDLIGPNRIPKNVACIFDTFDLGCTSQLFSIAIKSKQVTN